VGGAAGGGGGGGVSPRRALSVVTTPRDVESPLGVAPFAAELGRSASHAPAPTTKSPGDECAKHHAPAAQRGKPVRRSAS